MTLDIVSHSLTTSPFDSIRKYTEAGCKIWSARDLMRLLGYAKWERFGAVKSDQVSAIRRALISCQTSNVESSIHFSYFPSQGSKKSDLEDWQLSRYACYLIAMCGDVTKPEIAAAQSYFAVKTQQAELTEQLSEMQMIAAMALRIDASRKEQQRIAQIQLAQAEELEVIKQQQVLEASRTDELAVVIHQHESEIDRLFSPNGHYYSVIGYARNRSIKIGNETAKAIGKKCSSYCKANNIKVEKLNDSRYGSVGSYPESVIELYI